MSAIADPCMGGYPDVALAVMAEVARRCVHNSSAGRPEMAEVARRLAEVKDEMRSSGPSEGDTEISEDHIAIPIAALGAHSATQSYDSRAVYEPMSAIMSGR